MKPEDLLLAEELSSKEVCTFLEKYGFKDPISADRNLQLIAEEPDAREMLARIIGAVLDIARQSPDPDAALNNFERFLAVVPHPVNLLGFLWDTPEALEAVVLVCGTSPYSSEILIRNPEYFYWVLDQLGTPWVKSVELFFKEARQIISKFTDPTLQLRALARFKRREMLRMGARDILHVADLVGTVTELSNLADTVTQLVYEICSARLVERYGVPQYQDQQGGPHTAEFIVLGMGKLGGRELNYSSDIDLIYVYNGEQGRTCANLQEQFFAGSHYGTEGISNTEFFTKLAQSITSELSTLTEEGYFYRVDLRLRPEGSTGSVASSLTACRNYYATWGETFERMALIKARPVAGSADLGREFLKTIQPFVYRKFLDLASLDEIQEIKTRIDSKLGSRRKQEVHVKLGAGGIREIEFFVQALQLIYGGQTPDLQESGTLKALDKLLVHQYVREQEYRELREAYLFLRDLEHKLQLVFHLQTHELPDSAEELYRCARRMGFQERSVEDTLDRFRRTYQQHTANVNRIFQNLVTSQRRAASGDYVNEAALVLNKNLPEREVFPILSRHGFRDLRSAFHQIVLLRDAPSFAHSPSKMRNLLANLMPPLLGSLHSSPDPDAGLTYFEKFASTLGERDSLYTLLNESPEVLSRLMRILSSSQSLAEFLCHRPEFLDSLVRQDLLQRRKSLRDFRRELEQLLEKAGSREGRRTALRNYQQVELFRIGMKDLLGQLRRPQVGEQLAALAEACLLGAFDIACLELEHGYGKGFSSWARDHFAILALGKLGGEDLSYNSDLDLVFFYRVDDLHDSVETQRRCVRLVELLDQILSVSQGEGSIYKIDTRLRPEGKKGELVVAMHHYEEYLEKRAAAWERLALVRQRILSGGSPMRRQLKRWIEAFVYRSDLNSAIVAELGRIRHRMELEIGKEADGQRFHLKAGVGGLLDVEFATQLLQLKHGAAHQEIRGSNTTAVLKKLEASGLIARDQLVVFQDGYEFLRLLENRLRIASPYGTVYFSRTPETLSRVYRLLNPTRDVLPNCAEDFEKTYLARTREIRNHYQQILAALSAGSPD
jgi:glutamate-ammonia-ligase adenylyltransferase